MAAALENARAVTDSLRFLKIDLPGLGEQHLQVLKPTLNLDADKVILDTYLVTAGADRSSGIPLHVVARPALEQERFIMLKDMQNSILGN